jgi:hypothetical protein
MARHSGITSRELVLFDNYFKIDVVSISTASIEPSRENAKI